MRDMRPPRRPRVQPITLNDGDHQRILAVLPDARARAIIALEHGMGARRVEVSRLRVEDWYRREGMMLLTGKGGAQRFVPVPTDARAALDAYLAEHPATSGPFIRSYKRPHQPLSPGAIGHLVTQWMLEAGAKLAPWDGKSGHSLRRTAATEVLEVTGDIRAAQELLGHASLSSTAHYIRRVDLAGLRDALEARGSLGEGHRLREAA
jgi:integrase/recombinase XerD